MPFLPFIRGTLNCSETDKIILTFAMMNLNVCRVAIVVQSILPITVTVITVVALLWDDYCGGQSRYMQGPDLHPVIFAPWADQLPLYKLSFQKGVFLLWLDSYRLVC